MKKLFLSDSFRLLLVALFLTIFTNQTFLAKVSTTYPDQKVFVFVVFVTLFLTLFLFLRLLSFLPYSRYWIVLVLFFASLQAYVTDNFGVVGDQSMIRNVLMTDPAEVKDVMSIKLFLYFFFLGVLPSLAFLFSPHNQERFLRSLILKTRDITITISLIVITLITVNKTFASFLREQKSLRYYVNPIYFVYSASKMYTEDHTIPNNTLSPYGQDAKIPAADTNRELVIFVLGETARSDRFSLNGYLRETNPLLKKEDVFSFQDVMSCGTSTAASVPCMFSKYPRSEFNFDKASTTENLLDVLTHTEDVTILWRDNNSDSKGVAVRTDFEDYKTPKTNPDCDVECRDVGMLSDLQTYIDHAPHRDIFIVLHQLGSHGPAYFKRYPPKYEIFKPTCKNYDLGTCTNEEINNAYDNTIVYTDYFLSQVIQLLKKNDKKFQTTMIYVSDHGESLGEKGLYLHGLPYSLAPIEQKKVPLIMWFGNKTKEDIDVEAMRSRLKNSYSHDNIFHTVLGIFEIQTTAYDKNQDLLIHKKTY